MTLYLSSAQHTNLLDFLCVHDADREVPIKKMVGNFVLKQFVIYDMRNFTHLTDVILDRLAFMDTDEEFVRAVQEFLMMYSIRITVIWEGLSANSPLFHMLLDIGVENIVCGIEILDIQNEIRECLSERGMTRYSVVKHSAEQSSTEKYQFDCKNIVIAVVSSQPRMGATTVAIGLCTYLAGAGASVCYVEANRSGQLMFFVQSYGMEVEGDGWKYEGVYYKDSSPKEDMNFIVYGVGNSLNGGYSLIEKADLKLLVCGTNPNELGFTVRLQTMFREKSAYLLCPFVAEEIREDVMKVLQNDYHKIVFIEYQPEPTYAGNNTKPYENIVVKYIS